MCATAARWRYTKPCRLRARYDLGLSQDEFSRILGVRQQTVSEWETGLHTPRGASRRMLSIVAEQRAAYVTRPTEARGEERP